MPQGFFARQGNSPISPGAVAARRVPVVWPWWCPQPAGRLNGVDFRCFGFASCWSKFRAGRAFYAFADKPLRGFRVRHHLGCHSAD